ncbi:MAG: T9SS type A sorting domain-containing protein [Flavobacteriales bacterium]|nr:T9SS type A sorting domain-containing protein [Flavobacteriales bacterium]
MKRIFTLALSVLTASLSFAQIKDDHDHIKYCGQPAFEQRVKKSVGYGPVHQAMDDAYENEIQQIIASQAGEQRGSQTIYVIPIVFHIVHEGGPENISDEQVYDAVRILNRDYNKLNSDTSMVVSAFANNIADVGIEFRLAQYDELGNCVSGITRTFSTRTNDGDNAMVDDVNKHLNNSLTNSNNVKYPRNHYLNIWVCKNASGAAGYTMNPNNWNQAKYDGIWINHDYIGEIGTSSVVKSRALTHEVGHWLNLSHVWGSTNNPGVSCGDDNVTDTPQTEGWDNCNINGATCGNTIDNVQNYMEYSYCSRMFTNGQKSRMRAALISTVGQRNQLWTSTNLANTGTDGPDNLCAAAFGSNRYIICAGETINFDDQSYHGPTQWSWTFNGASPSSSTDENPSGITYPNVGQYTVSLTSGNGAQSVTSTVNNYITVIPNVGIPGPIVEGFETVTAVPNNEWFVYNADDGQTWSVVSGVAATGSKSIKMNNYAGGTGTIDEIISTTYDLSSFSSVTLSFKYAFAYKTNSNTDKLKVMVSNDCGASWSVRKTLSGTNFNTAPNTTGAFTPNSGQWVNVDVTNILPSYLVQNFMFKISFENGGGNNIYIDDINISGAVGIDELSDPFHVSVYPNPSRDFSTVAFYTYGNDQVEIELADMLGQVVASHQLGNMSNGDHQFNIQRGDLPAGVYFVRLLVGDRTVVKKLIFE